MYNVIQYDERRLGFEAEKDGSDIASPHIGCGKNVLRKDLQRSYNAVCRAVFVFHDDRTVSLAQAGASLRHSLGDIEIIIVLGYAACHSASLDPWPRDSHTSGIIPIIIAVLYEKIKTFSGKEDKNPLQYANQYAILWYRQI